MSRINESGGGLVIGIIIAVVVLVGGGVATYFMTDGFGMNNSVANVAEGADLGSADGNKPGVDKPKVEANDIDTLLAETVAEKTRIKCTFSEDGRILTMHAKSAINLRIDGFISDLGDAHIIRSGDKIYTWTEGSSEGFAVPVNDGIDPENSPTVSDLERMKNNEERPFDLRCERFNAPDSLFAPPNNVSFSDLFIGL